MTPALRCFSKEAAELISELAAEGWDVSYATSKSLLGKWVLTMRARNVKGEIVYRSGESIDLFEAARLSRWNVQAGDVPTPR